MITEHKKSDFYIKHREISEAIAQRIGKEKLSFVPNSTIVTIKVRPSKWMDKYGDTMTTFLAGTPRRINRITFLKSLSPEDRKQVVYEVKQIYGELMKVFTNET